MTDTLIRISCSETGDFSKLMLAPGLPMLDGKMLTYQVLQGWLQDLLAEPELDGDNVVFHVLANGQRQRILSRSFATQADLEGPLASDFERMRSALFNIKPVSPSERLIFSRLQPPVGDAEGFLFKARTEEGTERLVWCWGYQRRVSDGPLAICRSSNCSALFVKQGGPAEMCPLCGELIEKPAVAKSSQPIHRRRRPIGAVIASGTLLAAALGTYFFAPSANKSVESDDALIQGLESRPIAASEKAPQSVTVDTPIDTEPDRDPVESEKPRRKISEIVKAEDAAKNGSKETKSDEANKKPATKPTEPSVAKATDPLPEFKPFQLPEIPPLDPAPAQPDVPKREVAKQPPSLPKVIGPDLPPMPPQVAVTPKSKPPVDTKVTTKDEPQPLFPIEPKAAALKEKVRPLFPELPARETAKVELPQIDSPQKVDVPQKIELPEPSVTKTPAITILPPEPASPKQLDINEPQKPAVSDVVKVEPKKLDSTAPEAAATPQKTVGERQWHSDYLAAYQQAINDKKMLVMLFHDASKPDLSETRTSGFGAAELQESLDKYVRVSLPINFVAPNPAPNAPLTRLLEHRSFRHLRGQSGIAIVDLTDPQGPNYGRVVSALPLPEDGRYSPEVLGTLLQLPAGSIGQRAIVLAVRTGVEGDNFTSGEGNSQLHQLANRNARLMAQAEQVGSYDTAARVTAIRESFGDGIRIGELHFATDGPAPVQEAAIQAVSKWMQSPEDRRILNGTAFAYGIELFQSPNSQRWFATCIVLSR